jgi:hypothetical protein
MIRGRLRAASLLLLVLAMPAAACPVCIDKPEATLAERLLRADAVVIAREDPARPYHFAPVATLRGAAGAVPIPLLLDSTTRRQLTARPEEGVLFVRDGDTWTHAGYADAASREIVTAILAEGPSWEGRTGARFTFFEALLHHQNGRFRRLAIDELSRASYGQIRSMAMPIDGATARRALSDRHQIPWHGFYILMLGLSERAEDQALVRDWNAAATRLGGSRELDAWATALVEIDGAAGVSRLANDWFETAGRDVDAVRGVITALAVQAREGDPAVRPSILAALHDLPSRRPDVAGSVAKALGDIGDFSQADAIVRVMRDAAGRGAARFRDPEILAAAVYVDRARRAADAQQEALP